MSKLTYDREIENLENYDECYLTSQLYQVSSLYDSAMVKDAFINLKANIVDLNPALIAKCVQGTEQDFVMLMNKAKEFIGTYIPKESGLNVILLELFQECIFGYYKLTPLIRANDVSDIKVYAWNKVTCKANGERYMTNISFDSEDDYNQWYERILRIHKLQKKEDDALQYCTDTKGVDDYYLRIDIQLKNIVSTGDYNIHIRKIPKEKYTWEYLKKAGMLDDEMIDYMKDRIAAGYSFLISGKGGSGKTAILNKGIDLIPFSESILISQESDELYSTIHPQMQVEHTIDIKRNGETIEYTLEDELRLGLLQDIDNMIVGEIKGGEAFYVLNTAVSTGSRFFGTIHSNNAAGSVKRLIHCARYVSDLPIETLEKMLSDIKLVLLHLKHFSFDEILEVDGWDNELQQLRYKKVYKK